MGAAFLVLGTSFALHLVAVAILRAQASGDEQLSSELFALPIAAHHTQQAIRLLSLSHCFPWRPTPRSVVAAPVSVWATFMVARWSAVFLFLGACSFFAVPFSNV